MFWNNLFLVYEDQPQGAMRLKKERQTDLGLHKSEIYWGAFDGSMWDIIKSHNLARSPQFGSERGTYEWLKIKVTSSYLKGMWFILCWYQRVRHCFRVRICVVNIHILTVIGVVHLKFFGKLCNCSSHSGVIVVITT
jgi:hypothetical protein